MKTLSTEKDLLLKVDKVFPWETFRGKLESLYSKKPKWDVILLLKVLLIKFVYEISWLEGEIRDSKMFMKFLGGKVHQKSILLLQETVVDEGERMWTTLMTQQGLRQGD